MRKIQFIFLIIVGLSLSATIDVSAQKKRAQTSMKFLSLSPTAMSASMADAVTSLELGATSVFYNPAAIANGDSQLEFTGGVVEFIDDINYSVGAMTFRPKNRRLGVLGFSFVSVDYGNNIYGTVLSDTDPKGFEDTGMLKPTSISLGLAYANAITDQFTVGANFRYVKQDLGSAILGYNASGSGYNTQSYDASTVALDFGILYKTGFESLTFAMAIQNFAREVAYDIEKQELPLTFKLGISMDMVDLFNSASFNSKNHSLIASIDAHRPRDYDEQLVFGLDYGFLGRFNLRGGYAIPSKDEKGIAFGGGITQPLGGSMNLGVDYAYTEFGVFGNVNRISVRLDF